MIKRFSYENSKDMNVNDRNAEAGDSEGNNKINGSKNEGEKSGEGDDREGK